MSHDQLRDLIFFLAGEAGVAVVITDGNLSRPGPRITAFNSAFERLTGFPAADLMGSSPRLFQGARTSMVKRQRMLRDLKVGNGHRTALWNYRKSGEAYYCDIHIFPLGALQGRPEVFVAIEREIIRKPGRPAGS